MKFLFMNTCVECAKSLRVSLFKVKTVTEEHTTDRISIVALEFPICRTFCISNRTMVMFQYKNDSTFALNVKAK